MAIYWPSGHSALKGAIFDLANVLMTGRYLIRPRYTIRIALDYSLCFEVGRAHGTCCLLETIL